MHRTKTLYLQIVHRDIQLIINQNVLQENHILSVNVRLSIIKQLKL